MALSLEPGYTVEPHNMGPGGALPPGHIGGGPRGLEGRHAGRDENSLIETFSFIYYSEANEMSSSFHGIETGSPSTTNAHLPRTILPEAFVEK